MQLPKNHKKVAKQWSLNQFNHRMIRILHKFTFPPLFTFAEETQSAAAAASNENPSDCSSVNLKTASRDFFIDMSAVQRGSNIDDLASDSQFAQFASGSSAPETTVYISADVQTTFTIDAVRFKLANPSGAPVTVTLTLLQNSNAQYTVS